MWLITNTALETSSNSVQLWLSTKYGFCFSLWT